MTKSLQNINAIVKSRMEYKMFKSLHFVLLSVLLLSFSLYSQASTEQQIDTNTLIMQKNYLKGINECAIDKTFIPFMKSALKEANTFYSRSNYAQVIEEIILQNPACFVSSTNKLSQKECQTLNEQYIKEPFFYPRAMLSESLGRVKGLNQSCIAG